MNTALLDNAIAAMSALRDSLERNDDKQQDATVPAHALRDFVAALATLTVERKRYSTLPTYDEMHAALRAMVDAQYAGPTTNEML